MSVLKKKIVYIPLLAILGSTSLVYPAIEQVESTRAIVTMFILVCFWGVGIMTTFAVSVRLRKVVLFCTSILSFFTPFVSLRLLGSDSNNALIISLLVWMLVTAALTYAYVTGGETKE